MVPIRSYCSAHHVWLGAKGRERDQHNYYFAARHGGVQMVDLYTKFILTVIAVALLALTFRDDKAVAQSSGPVHVIVDQVASFAFQFAGPLAVRAQP
jgi:hypothetical protein